MQGVLETLVSSILSRAAGPGLLAILMAIPAKKLSRAQLKKIYVLDDEGEMKGEYILDEECPIDYDDFLKVLPEEGIGDREALFVGEYVFTAFQSGKLVFILLSRGQLATEDVDWTALLLTAAASHLPQVAGASAPAPRPPEPRPMADLENLGAERGARAVVKEKELAQLEARLQADEANLRGRTEELERQKKHLTAVADYTAQMQQTVSTGVARALQSLEMAEQIAASSRVESVRADGALRADARRQFEDERNALILAKDELEMKYRQAAERAKELEAKANVTLATLERERQENAKREADAEKMRAAIETRVQELSQRFAQLAKERLMNSHKPPETPGELSVVAKKELDTTRAELLKERKFLQRRAIELLDREEKLRESEDRVAARETEVAARSAEIDRAGAAAPGGSSSAADAEAARKDIEDRVKIIQQKAMELLDREERLRKRAEELKALETRLSGKVPAE